MKFDCRLQEKHATINYTYFINNASLEIWNLGLETFIYLGLYPNLLSCSWSSRQSLLTFTTS